MKQSANRGSKENMNIIKKFTSQLSVLEGGQSDVVCQWDGFYSPPAEALATVLENYECVSRRLRSLVTEVAHILH